MGKLDTFTHKPTLEGLPPNELKQVKNKIELTPIEDGINYLDLMQLTPDDIQKIPDKINEETFQQAYKQTAYRSFRRVIMGFTTEKHVPVAKDGKLFLEDRQPLTTKTLQDYLRQNIDQIKSDAIVEAEKLITAQEKANRDPLTQLLNKKGLEKNFERELTKIEKNDTYKGIGYVFIDIDDFKIVNDTYGQGVGDDVIRELARRLKEHVRSSDMVERHEKKSTITKGSASDLVMRMGGEELGVVLGNISADDLSKVAHKIHTSLKETPITVEHDGKNVPLEITTSIGATHLLRAECIDTPAEKLLKRAKDESNLAEMRSKEMGKDQVTIYDEMEQKRGKLTLEDFTVIFFKRNKINRTLKELQTKINLTTDEGEKNIRQQNLDAQKKAYESLAKLKYAEYEIGYADAHKDDIKHSDNE